MRPLSSVGGKCLSMCPRTAFPLCASREKSLMSLPLLTRIPVPSDYRPTLMTSFNFNYLWQVLSPTEHSATFRFRASTYAFGVHTIQSITSSYHEGSPSARCPVPLRASHHLFCVSVLNVKIWPCVNRHLRDIPNVKVIHQNTCTKTFKKRKLEEMKWSRNRGILQLMSRDER